MSYRIACPICHAVIWRGEDPPTRDDLGRVDRHEQGHAEQLLAETARVAA